MASPSLRPAIATLALIKLVVNTKYRFVYPFLPAIARGLGIDLTKAGMLASARWVGSLAAPAVMSTAAGSQRSRRLLGIGILVFATGAVVTAWTGFFVGALVGFVLAGLAKPMVDIGAQVYVSERVDYDRRARYMGILELSWAGGLLVGAPAAGWLIDNWDWRAPFWVVGSLGLVGLGLALRLLDRDDASIARPAARAEDAPGERVLWVLLTVSLFGFGHESVLVTLGGWLEDSFGMTLLALGGIGTLLAVAELVGEGGMVAFTDRIGKRNSVALGLGVGSASLLVLAFTSETLLPAVGTLMVVTVALEFGIISVIPLMTELRPRARTRMLSMSVVASGLGRMAGDFVAPRLFAAGGMRLVALTAGTVLVGAVVVVLSRVRDVSPVTPISTA